MEEKVVNKTLYKLLITLLKYTPFVLLLNDILHTLLSYLNYNIYIFNYIGGVSLIFIVILYILSYVFRFCSIFRFPLYYITITNIISLYDMYYTIPLSDLNLIRMYFILFGMTIIGIIYFKVKALC